MFAVLLGDLFRFEKLCHAYPPLRVRSFVRDKKKNIGSNHAIVDALQKGDKNSGKCERLFSERKPYAFRGDLVSGNIR
jgi:hypothetical protein